MVTANVVLYNAGCRCNCLFCKAGSKQHDMEKNISSELAKLKRIMADGHNIECVDISGNDPLEYLQLPSLIQEIKTMTGAEDIVLATHGMSLKNIDLLNELIDAGVSSIRIPIYGHTATIHDSVTDCEGSFLDIMNAFRNLRTKNLRRMIISTLVVFQNQSSLKELFYLFSKMFFATEFHVGFAGFVPNSSISPNFIPDIAKLRETLSSDLKYLASKKLNYQVYDLPYCISEVEISRQNICVPYRSYEHFNLSEYQKPIYLQKTKSSVCGSCKYDSVCEGFYKTYHDAGKFDFKPIIQN